jgi:hypothetical protein
LRVGPRFASTTPRLREWEGWSVGELMAYADRNDVAA